MFVIIKAIEGWRTELIFILVFVKVYIDYKVLEYFILSKKLIVK